MQNSFRKLLVRLDATTLKAVTANEDVTACFTECNDDELLAAVHSWN